jgi:predicted lipid-binding transport protein (Tim44 family)
MSSNFGYIDIILLAMIAGFIILRLRNILGRKTGHESKVFTDFSDKRYESFRKQKVNLEERNPDKLEGEEKKNFLKGAEIAYETIITSFAKGDQKKLDELLTRDMASNFKQAINERNKNGIKSELTFISMKESDLEKYEKIKTNLYATVKFVSEIISVKKDKDNKVIEGNPDRIKIVTDHWKFTKNILNQSPNWYLTEITNK